MAQIWREKSVSKNQRWRGKFWRQNWGKNKNGLGTELQLLQIGSQIYRIPYVTRPFCLVESRWQDAAANVGVLSVYLTIILYNHLQLFFDIERENIN